MSNLGDYWSAMRRDPDDATTIVRALWVSVGVFVVAMFIILILAFTSPGGNVAIPVQSGSTSGRAQAPITISGGTCVLGGCDLGGQCPSVVRALFGGDEGALDGCSGVETSRAFAILVVLAVGVGPLGLSMMAALCWGLRRAGRVTAALAGPPTAPTGPTRAPGADPGPHSPAGAGPESRAAPPVVR